MATNSVCSGNCSECGNETSPCECDGVKLYFVRGEFGTDGRYYYVYFCNDCEKEVWVPAGMMPSE